MRVIIVSVALASVVLPQKEHKKSEEKSKGILNF
jgi:hypothetical protein